MEKSCTISILLADDHQLVRAAFKGLLESEAAFQVVGETNNGPEALELVERLQPDVLLLDLGMRGMHGLEVLRRLPGQTRTRVLVVTMHADEFYLREALENGAAGYLLKDSAPCELAEAIRCTAGGGRHISEALGERMFHARLKRFTKSSQHSRMTSREEAVITLAAAGRRNGEIAAQLHVSRRTIEAHRASAMKKIGLRNQTDLVRYALRHNLASL